MRTVIISFSLLFIVANCTTKQQIRKEFLEEKIVIDFEDNILSTTFFWYSVDYDRGKPVYLFIDELFNLVELDLNEQKLINTFNIPRSDGPLGIKGGIWSPSLGLGDDYLIEGPFQYFLVKKNGTIQSKVNVKEKVIEKLKEDYQVLDKGLFIRTNGGHFKNDQKIIVSIGRENKTNDSQFPDFPQFALLEFLNQEKIKVEILDIKYPEELLGSDYQYVGQAEIPNYYFNGKWLVYNFVSFRELFFYNIETHEKRKIRLNILSDLKDKALPFGESPKGSTVYYGYPLVDFEKEIIYRYHIIVEPQNSTENKNYLSAYDFDGNLLSEYFLGKNSERMLRNSVLIGNYVYMNNFFQTSDDRIEFSRFSLQKNSGAIIRRLLKHKE